MARMSCTTSSTRVTNHDRTITTTLLLLLRKHITPISSDFLCTTAATTFQGKTGKEEELHRRVNVGDASADGEFAQLTAVPKEGCQFGMRSAFSFSKTRLIPRAFGNEKPTRGCRRHFPLRTTLLLELTLPTRRQPSVHIRISRRSPARTAHLRL